MSKLEIYVTRNNLSYWSTLDALTPFLGILKVSIPIAQLASGDAYGLKTQLPWGIELWGLKRHPTQIYYSLAGLVILFIIWPRKQVKMTLLKENGATFLYFVILTAAAHVFIDAFRGDAEFIFYNVRTSQVIAWIILAISLLGFKIINR